MRVHVRHFKLMEILLLAWLAAAALPGGPLNSSNCAAEEARYEREFSRSKPDIEKLLRGLQSPAGSRLPILEGFVIPALQPLERYGRAYYQYSFDVLALTPSQCRVRATAKISAWYQDPDPAKSSYQVLRSNGRLEQDILDRLTEAVEATPKVVSKAAATPEPYPESAAAHNTPPSGPASTPANIGTSFKFPSPGTSLPTREESAASIKPPDAEERHIHELQKQAKDLEEVLRNQAHPNNLLVVKHPRTPVAGRPSAAAEVILLADEGDEFQILNKLGSWVHIQISGISRGWIRSDDVELPDSVNGTSGHLAANAASTREPFTVDRQETAAFPGDWAALRGKTVRVVWVRPSAEGLASGARERRAFARSIFRATLPTLAESSPAEDGIAIVFDSADGGITAATATTLKSWDAGRLSDAEFWKQCSSDPPEAFDSSLGR